MTSDQIVTQQTHVKLVELLKDVVDRTANDNSIAHVPSYDLGFSRGCEAVLEVLLEDDFLTLTNHLNIDQARLGGLGASSILALATTATKQLKTKPKGH